MLIISGQDGCLRIDDFYEIDSVDGTPTPTSGSIGRDSKQLAAVYSKISRIDRSHDELSSSLKLNFRDLNSQMLLMRNNMTKLRLIPHLTPHLSSCHSDTVTVDADPVVTPLNNEASDEYKYSLSKRPKSLMALWTEYTWGIGGRFPAKDFTTKQKGKVSKQYYQRNLVWLTISRLTNKGYTASNACAKIKEVYGENLSLTKIIKLMQADNKATGGHPQLK